MTVTADNMKEIEAARWELQYESETFAVLNAVFDDKGECVGALIFNHTLPEDEKPWCVVEAGSPLLLLIRERTKH